ncbi:hypothetical protein GCM10008924_14570 [Gracilibacillus halotolerans]
MSFTISTIRLAKLIMITSASYTDKLSPPFPSLFLVESENGVTATQGAIASFHYTIQNHYLL